MPQGFQVPFPQRLWTSAGVPADSWEITTYVAGTTTPLTTYTTPELTSTNTNPIVTDSFGFFKCYVAAGVLIKVAVTDADGNPQAGYDFDNLEPMIDPAAATPPADSVQTGTIAMFGSVTPPANWLLCNGALVSRATYAALFAIVGTSFGAGDGSTTFQLPDFRGRFALGVATAGTGSTLGGTGGAIDHTHTGPSHTHVSTVTRDGWGSATTTPNVLGRVLTGLGAGGSNDQAANDVAITSAAGGTGDTGTANPPFQAVYFIIRT